ncbi:Nif3-like dinuclear metal center hexameric protein [Sphingobium sp. CR28]|uniref:Nif3-like dinuclear metal center hexameric protein n=1 Tax=Sphingobium sp. CR28 TaxID=3400272 RepID=UPI003FEF27F0
MTPRELVERMVAKATQEGAPPPARAGYRDTFKIGNPDVEITGIATTGMTTFRVLKRAVAEKRNFIIPHEGTWFNDRDEPANFVENDPLYLAKKAYCEENGLVIWRNHDLTHRMRPDQMFVGQLRLLGWTADEMPLINRMPTVTLPQPMTLARLARHVVSRCAVHAYRIAGPADMMVRKVAVGVGYAFPNFLTDPDVDVIVGGEAQEGTDSALPTHDLTQFAADSTALGRPRGLVLLGHMGTEDIGMQVVADWIRDLAPGVPIAYLPAGEPFARPF